MKSPSDILGFYECCIKNPLKTKLGVFLRACIADVITLWEQLEQSDEEGLLQGAVSKFQIHPLKATQVCHIEHLEKLVNIHMRKRLFERFVHVQICFAA